MQLIILAVVVGLAASSCGQRGPLYLRESPPPGLKPAPEVYEPVPYPQRPEREAGAAK